MEITDKDWKLLGQARGKIREWYKDPSKPKLPSYHYGEDILYFTIILRLPYRSHEDPTIFLKAYRASGSNLLEAIVGPHGWAVLQAHLIKTEVFHK